MAEPDPLVAPIYVTSRNAESAFGIPWDSLRAIAERFGVAPVKGVFSKRLMYRAADLVRAIERQNAQAPARNEDEEIRRELQARGFVFED
jgi:hypothetical protein